TVRAERHLLGGGASRDLESDRVARGALERAASVAPHQTGEDDLTLEQTESRSGDLLGLEECVSHVVLCLLSYFSNGESWKQSRWGRMSPARRRDCLHRAAVQPAYAA